MSATAVPFTVFCRTILDVRLTPAQRVLAAVAFDGVDPAALAGRDRALAERLFGAIDTVPDGARGTLVAVCGARGGKSMVFIALRALHLSLTVPLRGILAPGEVAAAIIVAPDGRVARQALRYALGAARRTPLVARLIVRDWADGFELLRPDGAHVRIECLPATRGGSALRGRSLVFAGLDEAAFFRDTDHVVNDAELYAAVNPRLVPGGQIVIASTPWAEGGLVYDLFVANHGHPRTALAAHAPTTLMRPDSRTRGIVERERERDPDNCQREFDAEFMPLGAGHYFDSHAIDDAMVKRPLALTPDLALPAVAAVDLGFRSDASAAVVVRREGNLYRVAEVLELRPTRGQPLQPSVVVAAFAAMAKRHGCQRLVSDFHYVESLREHAQAAGLQIITAPGGLASKLKAHASARALLHEGRCEFSREHRALTGQLREVTSKPTSGGGLTITSPRRRGSHGDLASAWVLAMWAASQRHAAAGAYQSVRHWRGPPRRFAGWGGSIVGDSPERDRATGLPRMHMIPERDHESRTARRAMRQQQQPIARK